MVIVKDDIACINADIIVNASNAIGYMGGIIGRFIKLNGVAQSIHYKTKGKVEKEAKKASKERRYKPGDIFVTGAGELKAAYIIHAVTMSHPGTTTNIEVVKELLPKILSKAYELKAKSIAIPLLGAGVGKVSKDEVLKKYEEFFKDVKDIEVIISYV